MHYTLILYDNGKEGLCSARCLLESLQKNAGLYPHQGEVGVTVGAGSVLVRFCSVNQNLEVIDSANGGQWTALNSLDAEHFLHSSDTVSEGNECSSSESVTLLADYLHDIADNLPYTGFTLDVYTVNLNMKQESCLLTVGALLRLREWHKGQVRIVADGDEQQDGVMQTLCAVLHATFLHPDQLCSCARWPVWRGDLVWPGEKGFVQQGVCLECGDWERLENKLWELHFWSHSSSYKDWRVEGWNTDLRLGPQMEVLTHICLASMPLYLFDDFSLQLHVNPETTFGRLVETLNQKDALLLRIPLYVKGIIPMASSHGLTTSAWKEGIAASERPTPDPERGSLSCRQHLFLMVSGGQDPASPLTAIVLRSPSEVSTELFEEIHQASYFICDLDLQALSQTDSDSQIRKTMESLPLLTAVDFGRTDDACLQSLVQCISEKKSMIDERDTVKMTAGQLLLCVREGQEAFLQQGQKQTSLGLDDQKFMRSLDIIPLLDLERVSSEWPERRALLENESKAKVLRRYQSNESCSLMLSSPLAPEDSSMDAKDMVKWFKPDGNAIHEDLSPVKPAVRPQLLSNHDEVNLEWPACKDLQYHDVYYETSKKSERQEQFFQKFRDNILLEESLHVCSDKPHVPALRYRSHSSRRSQMDVSCGGSKLTPITRTSLSPNSMLQATPSAKRRLSRDSGAQGDSRSSRDDSHFSTPKVSVRKDRSLSSESSQSGKERRHSQAPALGASFEEKSNNSSGSVFYPKKSDSSLPPFRRLSKPSVSIFSPSLSQKLPSQVTSDGDLSENASRSSTRQRSTASVSSEEDAERRLSSESTGSKAPTSSGRSHQSRSQRHKRRLEKVVAGVLEEAGVTSNDTLYPSCFSKLLHVSTFFVKQLTHSHNLKAEMKAIAQKQVEQVVDLERRRQDLAVKKKLRKTSLVG
ncbi:mdm2-binding protein-like isoform X2 [Babylonia areolata]|uniref:mdm2-binding protein-like isoform X2 n=1 Tax=Babylonia areolata TaxID=304850 RepID=UPI003FD36896